MNRQNKSWHELNTVAEQRHNNLLVRSSICALLFIITGSAVAAPRSARRSGTDYAMQLGSSHNNRSRSGSYHHASLNKPASDDNWLGGTGNWSNAALWNAGVPNSGSDVFVGSGGADYVNIDVSNASINSLTIGGAAGESGVNGVGTPLVLDIAGALTVKTNGYLQFFNNQTINAATLSNTGSVYVGYGATLNLTNQPGGITDIVKDSIFYLSGTFNAGNHSATANLTSIEGNLTMDYFEKITTTPAGGTFAVADTGAVDITNQAILAVTGDMKNAGSLTAESSASGGYALDVSGEFTNQSNATLSVRLGKVNMGSLSNEGLVINWGNINLAHQPNGITDIVAGSEFRNYGSVTANGNDAFGHLQSIEGRLQIQNGQINNVTPTNGPLTIAAPGYLELDWIYHPGTTLQVNGDLNNAGWIKSNGGSLMVTGTLTNNNRLDMFGNGLPDQNLLTAMGMLVNNGRITVAYDPTVSTPHLVNAGSIDVDKQSAFMVGTGTSGLGYQQFADGILTEAITGQNIGGKITIEGSAILDGTLEVVLENGFIPLVGSSYKFLNFTPGELSGEFANITNDYFNNGTEKWVVNYDGSHGYVELLAVAAQTPEPGSLLLLGPSGLGAIMFLRRMRPVS